MHPHINGWTLIQILKTASMASGAIRRLQDRVLGPSRTGIPSSTSEIWLLGVCYKISESESSQVADAFTQDFSSFVLMTYRRGLFVYPLQLKLALSGDMKLIVLFL